eukprot:Blabericola_migrator_1__4394@NODE_235_length_10999_cov_256_628796_g200_i0_p3_GENE_NODE_235_length_10999_cov_256_628796_g200_i0NODE_235_length_10999_cov_256_628796_g200_i0_p3_ORF_typecomplete_len589_score46_65_NODE_235_length_10999_cov_256_628796_g200_i077389504
MRHVRSPLSQAGSQVNSVTSDGVLDHSFVARVFTSRELSTTSSSSSEIDVNLDSQVHPESAAELFGQLSNVSRTSLGSVSSGTGTYNTRLQAAVAVPAGPSNDTQPFSRQSLVAPARRYVSASSTLNTEPFSSLSSRSLRSSAELSQHPSHASTVSEAVCITSSNARPTMPLLRPLDTDRDFFIRSTEPFEVADHHSLGVPQLVPDVFNATSPGSLSAFLVLGGVDASESSLHLTPSPLTESELAFSAAHSATRSEFVPQSIDNAQSLIRASSFLSSSNLSSSSTSDSSSALFGSLPGGGHTTFLPLQSYLLGNARLSQHSSGASAITMRPGNSSVGNQDAEVLSRAQFGFPISSADSLEGQQHLSQSAAIMPNSVVSFTSASEAPLTPLSLPPSAVPDADSLGSWDKLPIISEAANMHIDSPTSEDMLRRSHLCFSSTLSNSGVSESHPHHLSELSDSVIGIENDRQTSTLPRPESTAGTRLHTLSLSQHWQQSHRSASTTSEFMTRVAGDTQSRVDSPYNSLDSIIPAASAHVVPCEPARLSLTSISSLSSLSEISMTPVQRWPSVSSLSKISVPKIESWSSFSSL